MQDSIEALKDKGVKVIGVSMDKTEDQKAYHEKHSFPFPLLCDPEGELVGAFGVKKFAPKVCARESFLVRDGKLVWVERKAKPKDHAATVLAAIEALEK